MKLLFGKVGIVLFLAGALAFTQQSLPAGAQMAGTTATGTWKVRPTQRPLSPGIMILRQQGNNVVGSYGRGGTIKGTVSTENPHELDINWSDRRGSGWGKITFSSNWNQFHGEWGYPGQVASGELYATRMMMQINTAGLWNVRLTGQQVHNAQLRFQQKGTSFVGTWPSGHVTGTIPAGTTEVKGTWQTKTASGPLYFKFSADGNSFDGYWGYPGKASKGRVFGTRVMTTSSTR
jgi:hypothetical protein